MERGLAKLHPEQIDEIFVKIHVGVQVPGELCEHAVVFDTGYLAGADHLTGDGRRAAVVVIPLPFRRSLQAGRVVR